MRDISRNTSRCFKPAVVNERVCSAFRRALSCNSFRFVFFMRNIADAALGRLEGPHSRRGGNGVTSGSCPWWFTGVLYGNFD